MTDLLLRAPRLEDVPALTAMANLPGVRAGTLRLPYTTEEFMRRRALEAGPNAHPIVGVVDGRAVAMGTLVRGTGRRSHAGDVFLMVHDEFWGRGIGGRLLVAPTGLADDWLGLSRLQLEVSVDNVRAIRLYERAGFEIEGTLRGDTIRDGRLWDSHVMGRLRSAPTRRQPTPPRG